MVFVCLFIFVCFFLCILFVLFFDLFVCFYYFLKCLGYLTLLTNQMWKLFVIYRPQLFTSCYFTSLQNIFKIEKSRPIRYHQLILLWALYSIYRTVPIYSNNSSREWIQQLWRVWEKQKARWNYPWNMTEDVKCCWQKLLMQEIWVPKILEGRHQIHMSGYVFHWSTGTIARTTLLAWRFCLGCDCTVEVLKDYLGVPVFPWSHFVHWII